jgi:hypothetical protein
MRSVRAARVTHVAANGSYVVPPPLVGGGGTYALLGGGGGGTDENFDCRPTAAAIDATLALDALVLPAVQ